MARFVSLKPERQLVLAENGTVNCEVVSPDGTAPAARFAAKELQKYLSESIGAPVPLVKKAGTGKVSILVGTGADVSELPRDGFIIRAAGSRIIIAGRDDTRYTPGLITLPGVITVSVPLCSAYMIFWNGFSVRSSYFRGMPEPWFRSTEP